MFPTGENKTGLGERKGERRPYLVIRSLSFVYSVSLFFYRLRPVLLFSNFGKIFSFFFFRLNVSRILN